MEPLNQLQPLHVRKSRSISDSDLFQCKLCEDIVIRPKQCFQCGSLFCDSCIVPKIKIGKNCPEGCLSSNIKDMSVGLKRIYNQIEMKCKYHDICHRVLKMSDIAEHEENCQMQECIMFDVCSNRLTKNKKYNDKCCSPECHILSLLKTVENPEELYQTLEQLFPTAKPKMILEWDETCKSSLIKAQGNHLQASNIITNSFISAVTRSGFTQGEHYWEIKETARQSLLKVGVTTTKYFNYDVAFCDLPTGFAFYSIGELRNGSDCKGFRYGAKPHYGTVIGVYLNMNIGLLGFVVNGKYYREAYKSQLLTKGEIFPAISFIKTIDCTIVEQPVPDIIYQLHKQHQYDNM